MKTNIGDLDLTAFKQRLALIKRTDDQVGKLIESFEEDALGALRVSDRSIKGDTAQRLLDEELFWIFGKAEDVDFYLRNL